MLAKVIIINGYPRSGKDTVVAMAEDMLAEEVHNVSTVDKVKEAAKALGWNGEKSAAWRNFLHELKMLWTREFEGPLTYINNSARELVTMPGLHVMFVHSREIEEIKRFRLLFTNAGIDCVTLLVKRDGLEAFDNDADANVENGRYDHIIANENSENWKSALTEKVRDFLNKIGLEA